MFRELILLFKKVNENFILLGKFFFQNLFLSESSRNQIKKISTFKYLLVVYICSEQKYFIIANRFNCGLIKSGGLLAWIRYF